MTTWTGKIYNISPTTPRHRVKRPPEKDPRRPRPGAKPNADTGRHPLLAYLTGPVAVVFWTRGWMRISAAIVTLCVIAACVVLAAGFSQLSRWFASLPYSVSLWLTLVPGALVAVATTWSIAIAMSERSANSVPRWLRQPWSVLMAGIVIPGLGLYIAGHRLRASMAFWLAGPLAATAIVIVKWRWFWGIAQANARPGIAGRELENVFIAAAVIAAVCALLWIVQALDGVRCVSRGQSRVSSNAFSVLLVVVLVYAAAAFQPTVLAENLYHTSVELRSAGLQLVPLVLCDTATRLDPVNPRYLADAAELNDALGMPDAALSKRAILSNRASAYAAALLAVDPAAAEALRTELGGIDLDKTFGDIERRQAALDEDCLPLMRAHAFAYR